MFRAMKRIGLVVVALSLGLIACKKDDKKTAANAANTPTALPVEMQRKPAAVDTSKLATPALFANIPADTPYLIGSFQAVPLDYMEKIFTKVGPTVKKAFDQMRDQVLDPTAKSTAVLEAVLSELDGKWNAAGVESLGFSAQPRFAIYGLGLVPVVARFEVKDDKAVLATVQRIATKAGASLPVPETRDGKSFWRFVKNDGSLIVALLDNQLVVGFGPTVVVDQKLNLILGIEKPAQSMADGKALAKVMTDYGYAPYIVGYFDSKLVMGQVAALKAQDPNGKAPSAACMGELDRLADRAPRIVFGYHELTTKKQTMSFVIELAPDLVKQLEALRAEVPGLGAAMANQPLLAFGGGLDIAGGVTFLRETVTSWQKVAQACEVEKAVDDFDHALRDLSKPLPPQVAKFKGGVLALQDIAFGQGSPIPQKIEGFAIVEATDAKGLFDEAIAKQPKLGQFGIQADGHLHELPRDKLPIPFAVNVGVGDHTFAAAIGDKGKDLGERMMNVSGGGKAPFIAMTYDYGRLIQLSTQMKRMKGTVDPSDDMNAAMADLFSRGSMTLDTSDKGLVIWASLEMK
jgi:hypothetical protein